MNLRALAEAEDEVDSARSYLNQQVDGLGDRFLDDLHATFRAIRLQPNGYPLVETLRRNQQYHRALLKTFRYVVVFEIVSDEVLIVAVAHTSRAPNYWLGRHG